MLINIEQAFDLTKKIQKAVTDKDWDQVVDLQESRGKLMLSTQQLPTPTNEEASLQIEKLISSIQQIDAQILPLITEHMRSLSQERQQTNQGKKMTKAYQST